MRLGIDNSGFGQYARTGEDDADGERIVTARRSASVEGLYEVFEGKRSGPPRGLETRIAHIIA